jgi:hypothetical protein
VTNIYWHGNHLAFKADKTSLTVGGKLPNTNGMTLKVVLRDLPQAVTVSFNGKPVRPSRGNNGLTCHIPLKAGTLTWKAV